MSQNQISKNFGLFEPEIPKYRRFSIERRRFLCPKITQN
nr:MAG TPA: hypothetical protein [Caudoviricetes sp.]